MIRLHTQFICMNCHKIGGGLPIFLGKCHSLTRNKRDAKMTVESIIQKEEGGLCQFHIIISWED